MPLHQDTLQISTCCCCPQSSTPEKICTELTELFSEKKMLSEQSYRYRNGDIDYSQRLTSVIRVQSVKLLILDPRSSEDQNQLQLPFLLFVLADFQDKMPKEFFRSMSVPTISNNWCQTKQYKETRTNYMFCIYCNRSSVPSRIQRFGQVFKRRIWDQVMQ
jgi:hypothetical protein